MQRADTVGGSGSMGEDGSVGGGDRRVVEAESDGVETTHRWSTGPCAGTSVARHVVMEERVRRAGAVAACSASC
jgi:hypothetical protein